MPDPNTHSRPTAGALLLTALCLLALLAPISASAAERVGRVLIASGDVTAQRKGAPARDLARQDPIYAQDTIETGTDGRIQIQFTDGGMVDLQPDSRFRIAEYELEDDGGGSAVIEFLRGALRTVTGSIGDDEDDEYRMDTPVATIGIRGTAYALHYCDAPCTDAGGQLGLYGRVHNGGITVGNGSDAISLGADQFFFVPEDGSPRRIVAPPEGILDGNGGEGGERDGGQGTDSMPGSTPPPSDEPGIGITNGNGPLAPTFESSETTNVLPGVTDDFAEYADTDNLASPSVVEDLTAGYNEIIDAPSAVGRTGELWDLNGLDLQINVPDNVTSLNSFSLDPISDSYTLSLDSTSYPGSVDTASSSFTVDSLNLGGGTWSGNVQGRFLGENGEAVVIGYELDRNDGNNSIRGVAIIQEGGGV